MSINWHTPATVTKRKDREFAGSYGLDEPIDCGTLADAVRYVTKLGVEDRLRAAIVVGEQPWTSKTILEIADIEGLASRRDFPGAA
jgi:hypothetical protein